MKLKLGDEAKDRITGFQGIVICVTEWISGCTRTTLQPLMGKDGKLPEPATFDEPMLELVKASKVKVGLKDTGGPRPEPSQARAPR